MANIVAVTVRASDSPSDWTKIRADAAKAGSAAADAFNEAFKLKARGSATTKDKLESTGGVSGDDRALVNKLKSYANTPGGIGILGTGNDTSLLSMLKSTIRQQAESGNFGLVSGSASSTDVIRQVLAGNGPSNVSTSDIIKQVLTGDSPGNTSTKDFIDQVMQGNAPGNVTTEDMIKQVLTNNVTGNVTTKDFVDQVIEGNKPGNMSTTDTIHEKIDTSGVDGKKDGGHYGGDFLSAFRDVMGGSGGGEGGGGGGGIAEALSGALNSGGVAGGALPGVAGISGMAATVTGLAGALIAVLPAITAVVGGLGAIGGGFAILETTNKKFAADMKSALSSIEGDFASAAAPLARPLEMAATQIAGYFKMLEPEFKAVFGDSGQLVEPLVKAIEGLVSGVLPGFLALIKAGAPVFASFAASMRDLGGDLGALLGDFASAGSGSATILKALVDLIGSLLPFIGDLAKVLVSALAPAFAAFSTALQAVLPALKPLISIIGSFAGAVLTDLAGVLGAVGTLLVDLAPSFRTLSQVAASLFNTLENTGVFASLGNVLENLAQPIANLVNALVRGLAPALPSIISLISSWTSVLVELVSAGLAVLVSALVKVVQYLSPVLPLLLDAVVAWKALTVAVGVFNAVMDFNPFAAIALALIAIVGLIIKYHQQILAFIEATWKTIASFVAGVWDDIEATARAVWGAISGFLSSAWSGMESDAKSVWNGVLSFLRGLWNDIESAARSTWDSITSFFTSVGNNERSGFEAIWNAILGFFRSIWGSIESTMRSAASAVEGALSSAWNSVYATVKAVWGSINSFFGGVPGKILGAVSSLASGIYSWAVSVMKGMLSGFESVWDSIVNFFKGLAGDILSALGIHSPPQWAIDAGMHIMNGIGIGMTNAQSAVTKAAKLVQNATSGYGKLTGSAGSVEALMQQMAAAKGWSGTQWQDLYAVEMREAGFNLNAQNPTSGAYGLAQFINGPSEYAQYGGNANTAAGQITAMLNYITQRYGNPANAWLHEESFGWYDHGGWLPTGMSIAYNTTGRPEPVGAMALGGGPQQVNVQLSVDSAGSTAFEQFMVKSLREWVRVKGGGNVQMALGRN